MASKELFAAFVMHKTKRLLVGKSLTVFLEENTEKQENASLLFYREACRSLLSFTKRGYPSQKSERT